jgi:transcription elongation factor SPT6
MFWF